MNDTARATAPASASSGATGRGLAAASTAFFIWGLLPLYLKALQTVPVLQVAAHRLVWGCLFAFGWLVLRGQLGHVRAALREPKTRWRLCASATLIALNWIIYVFGIATDRVIETSLGYFINPLVNVLLGVMILSERLNTAQWSAVALAAGGVGYLTWSAGHLPWISLALALTFGLYGLVRKVVRVEALAGFASETLLLFPAGAAFLLWCAINGTGAAGAAPGLTALLVLGGPITAVPLVLFAAGARRIPYSTIGLLQYLAPTIQLSLGVFVFHEPFRGPRVAGFILIWTALVVYAADGVWRARRRER